MRSLLAPLLVAFASPAGALTQDALDERWAPVPSERRIAFRVVHPEDTPANEPVRLVLEAARQEPVLFAGLESALTATYRTVESIEAPNGAVVRLALPVEADWTRVRLEARSMYVRPVHLDDVEIDRPPIVLRPRPAASVRVFVERDEATDSASVAGVPFEITVVDHAEPLDSQWRTRSANLVLDQSGRGELHGVPVGATLSAGPLARRRTSQGEPTWVSLEGARAPDVGVALVGSPLDLERSGSPFWALRTLRLACIRGRIVEGGGAPIDGARVSASAAFARATTAADGRFELQFWPHDDERWPDELSIHAPRHASRTVDVPRPGEDSAPVELGAIELEPHPPIRCRLVLADGAPVPDFPLSIGPSLSRRRDELRTDGDGRFLIRRPRYPSTIVVGRHELGGRGEYEVGPLQVRGGAEELELTVRPVVPFVGFVEYDDGAPVGSVQLLARLAGGAVAPLVESRGWTFEATLPVVDGRFEWDELARGRWTVTVSVEAAEPIRETIDHGVGEAPPRFRMSRPAALAGRVLTATGDPVPGARVVARDASGRSTTASTDASGAYRIAPLPAGTYRVRAWIRSARTEPVDGVELERGSEVSGVDLVLPAGPVLTFVVVDQETGDAVRGASVDLARGDDHLPNVRPNAQGVVRYGPLAPGVYCVNARWPGHPSPERASRRRRVHTSFLTIEPDTPDQERTIEVW
ncbi:MAG: carboxypeptidase-like regulatory domain-containing protein [Planctomycetota bacterium]